MLVIWLLAAVTAARFHHVDGEIFSATSDLKHLVQFEASLLSILTEFMADRKIESEFLQQQYALRKVQHHETMTKDSELHKPLNAYRTIKGLAVDWPKIETAMRNGANSAVMSDWSVITSHQMFPTYEDFTGAVKGLVGLQETYKLETSSLANGIIDGVDYGANLTASDCFELGRELYNAQYFNQSLGWLKVALIKHKHETLKSVPEAEIMEHLAYALYKSGERSAALTVIDKVLQKQLSETVRKNVVQWKSEVELEDFEKNQTENGEEKGEIEGEIIENADDFKAVCRGESTATPDEIARLKCKLFIRNPHFLTPFKVEEVYVHPSFVAYLYHDILTAGEISMAITEAEGHLIRTEVLGKDGKRKVSEVRTAKMWSVALDEDKINVFVNQKIESMTGLNLKTTEKSQIINYGIGGQYKPHTDFILDYFSDTIGDRLATVMFYMSDVEQGGATAFPLVSVMAKPEKGSALVWYNLLPDGNGNNMSLHCGCPVLVGSKWILVKWIHEREQIFTRPCTINNHLWKLWD